ncbi:endonuclease/exonuclease/phosphatase family protein [Actinomycetospora endophytica]|uniref:Endonuclease/exonuclease/phosphatase family protein n=1 Tax=Actinomycetospora endophytica TaxID=2291215 RepID=A0ABS8PDM7_9PSEU|nr:endonuclease/exonuclease/phosphatase family protein [Actinomycetospora endophytica]MCD2196093.1 endonuclease/exonuclease/phosphatase family protein [Actinomycetospora endophytica]
MAQTVSAVGGRAPRRPIARAIIGVVVVLLAVVVLLPDLLGLDRFVLLAAMVALRPQLTVLLALAALLVLLVRRRRWPESCAVIAVCLVAATLVVPRAFAQPSPPPGGRALTVLSFNVDQGGADVGALAAEIRRARPDVVVLPEAADRFAVRLGGAIPDLGYRSVVAAAPGAPDVHGIAVLTASAMGPLSSRVIWQGHADPWLELSGGALGGLRLVAVHVAAPVPGKIRSWPRELAQLATWCGAGPAVLVGDFNATLDHAEFRAGSAGCQDAAAVTGNGLTATWNAAWPRWFGAQIDHVLVGGDLRPEDLLVLDLPGSDHRALLARVRMPG